MSDNVDIGKVDIIELVNEMLKEIIKEEDAVEVDTRVGTHRLRVAGSLIPKMERNGTATITIKVNGGAQDW